MLRVAAIVAAVTAGPPTAAAGPAVTGPLVGLNAGGAGVAGSADAARGLGATLVRTEFPIDTPPKDIRATIGTYADRGVSVLLLAGFPHRVPTEAEAGNLATWAHEFGPGGTFWAKRTDGFLAVRAIEFGNETSYSYHGTATRSGEYALRFRDAHRALRGTGVGLLAQADDANISERWVNDMFAAVPDLADMVDGWTIHPYGPRTSWQPRIDRLVAQTARHGGSDSIPIDITEWGLASDGGRCLSDNYGWPDRCMTYAAAAAALRASVEGMAARYGSRLRRLIVYQATDLRRPGETSHRDHYFGALKRDMTDKGAYSAELRALLTTGIGGADLPASPGSWFGSSHGSGGERASSPRSSRSRGGRVP